MEFFDMTYAYSDEGVFKATSYEFYHINLSYFISIDL